MSSLSCREGKMEIFVQFSIIKNNKNNRRIRKG
jgi:hypothetical protein